MFFLSNNIQNLDLQNLTGCTYIFSYRKYSNKNKSTPSSPCGRGAAVFEAGAENYGCGEGTILTSRKNKNRKDINMKTLSSIFPLWSNSRLGTH